MQNIGKLSWDSHSGLCFPEGRVESETKKIIAQLKCGENITIGCPLLFNQIRIAVKDGELPPIFISVNDELLEINKNGFLKKWPVGFCDLLDKQLIYLIKFNKEEKNAS